MISLKNLKTFYMNLPYDLSGSISKNRFRNEVLWGLSKIYEVYKTGKDFIVVFDFMCDVEVHVPDENTLELYQIKTNNKSKPNTLKKILYKDTKSGNSILGKLYFLKCSTADDVAVKVAIVSNCAFVDNQKNNYMSPHGLSFKNLSDSCKTFIANAFKDELADQVNADKVNVHKIDFENIFYIFTSIDLFDPQESLIGKTVFFFKEVTGEEPKKPYTLYCLLSDMVSQKACCELVENTYEDIIEKKGISRADINLVLDNYSSKIDNAVQKAKEHISHIANFQERLDMLKALGNAKREIIQNKSIHIVRKKIEAYIEENGEVLSDTTENVLASLYNKFIDVFPIEYSALEKKAFILLAMMGMEESIYEKFEY